MTTIYFSKQDCREDMQNPHSSQRAHAICRRLTGVKQDSLWYGAHYWAACGMLDDRTLTARSNNFAYECDHSTGHDFKLLDKKYRLLWQLAVKRVRAILPEALALKTSVEW